MSLQLHWKFAALVTFAVAPRDTIHLVAPDHCVQRKGALAVEFLALQIVYKEASGILTFSPRYRVRRGFEPQNPQR